MFFSSWQPRTLAGASAVQIRSLQNKRLKIEQQNQGLYTIWKHGHDNGRPSKIIVNLDFLVNRIYVYGYYSHTHVHIYTYIIIYMGVNYNISLTWIKAIKGDDFPLKTMIPGFSRSEVVISYPSSFRPRGRAAAHLPWYHLPQSRWPWQWPAAAHNRRR